LFLKSLKDWYFSFVIFFWALTIPISSILQYYSIFQVSDFKLLSEKFHNISTTIIILCCIIFSIILIALSAIYPNNYPLVAKIGAGLIGELLASISVFLLTFPNFYFCNCIVKLLTDSLIDSLIRF
jgi:hypothetical protein